MKLRCSTIIAALVMAISVFLGNIGHSEFKSKMKKRRLRKQNQEASIRSGDCPSTPIHNG